MNRFTLSLLTATAIASLSTAAFAQNVNTLSVTQVELPSNRTALKNSTIIRQTGSNGSITGSVQGNGLTTQIMQLSGNGNKVHFETPNFDQLPSGAHRQGLQQNYKIATTGKVLVVQHGNENEFTLKQPFTPELYNNSLNANLPGGVVNLVNDQNIEIVGNKNKVASTNGNTTRVKVRGNENELNEVMVTTTNDFTVSGNGNKVTRYRKFGTSSDYIQGNGNTVTSGQNISGNFRIVGDNNNIVQNGGTANITGSGNTVTQSSLIGTAVLNATNTTGGTFTQTAGYNNRVTSTVNDALNSSVNVNSGSSNVNTKQETVTNSSITKGAVNPVFDANVKIPAENQMSPVPAGVYNPTTYPSGIANNQQLTQVNTQNSAIASYESGSNTVNLEQRDVRNARATVLVDSSNARINSKQWASNDSSIRLEASGTGQVIADLNQGHKSYYTPATGSVNYTVPSARNNIDAQVYGENQIGVEQTGYDNSISTTMITTARGGNKQFVTQSGNRNSYRSHIEGSGNLVTATQSGSNNSIYVTMTSLAKLGPMHGYGQAGGPNDVKPASVFAVPTNNTVNILQGGTNANLTLSASGNNNNIDLTQACQNCRMTIGAHTDNGSLKVIQGRNNDNFSAATTSNKRIEIARR